MITKIALDKHNTVVLTSLPKVDPTNRKQIRRIFLRITGPSVRGATTAESCAVSQVGART